MKNEIEYKFWTRFVRSIFGATILLILAFSKFSTGVNSFLVILFGLSTQVDIFIKYIDVLLIK